MLPGIELIDCPNLAVPQDVMRHIVHVESSYNPYAIGVVGGRLVRQPRSLPEAVATARMLEQRGYNFSVGLAQVNRHNLARYGLETYQAAFGPCANLRAGAKILAECHRRAGGDWGKAFSCYYSGNFVTGYRHGYVHKIYASMKHEARAAALERPGGSMLRRSLASPGARSIAFGSASLVQRRGQGVVHQPPPAVSPAAALPAGAHHSGWPGTGHPARRATSGPVRVSVGKLGASVPAAQPFPYSIDEEDDRAFVF